MDLFAALGLPTEWNVSQAALAEAFRQESKKHHPDRFYTKSPAEKRLAMARTTDITEAYRTLKDPIGRAIYLLRLSGKTVDQKAAVPDDPLLLSEVMDAREAAQELRAQGAAASDSLSNLLRSFEEKVRAVELVLGQAFVSVDQDVDRQKAIDSIHRSVIRHRYYSGTRDEIKRALDHVRA